LDVDDSTEISEELIKKSLRNSILAGAVGTFFFMIVHNGPIPLMLEKLGAGGVAIGLTSTLIQLGMLVQIPSAFFAERLASRKLFWMITNFIARALIAVPGLYLLLFPDQHSPVIWLMLAAIGIYSFLAQTSAPSWFSWMTELMPEALRASFWGRRQGVAMVVSVLSVSLTGWFLDLFGEQDLTGFGWILVFASLTGIGDVLVHLRVTEPVPKATNRTLSVATRILRPLQQKDFRFFTLAMCVWFFGLGLFSPFMNVYLKATFGVTYTHLSAFQLAGMISSVTACFLGGRLIERMGLRSYGLALVVSIPLLSLPWFFLNGNATGWLPILGAVPQPIMMLCCGALIAGGVFAGVGLLQLNLLSALAPDDGRTMAMAVHWTLVGIISALGPLAGGWIKDFMVDAPLDVYLYSGTRFSYFHVIMVVHGLLIWGIMLPLLLRVRKKGGEWPLNQAIIHIFIVAPLRSVRDVYNFSARFIAATTAKSTNRIAPRSATKSDDEEQ
jgi:MFS family permease